MPTVAYGVKSWFNMLCDLWGTIQDDKKRRVMSYRLEKIPESVSNFPCAISFLADPVDVNYSMGGPATAVYHGKTEFHVVGGLQKNLLSYVLTFPDKIVAAAASSITLGGLVVDFHLVNPGSIDLLQLQWGSEAEHFGYVVNWYVQENQSGKYTVSP